MFIAAFGALICLTVNLEDLKDKPYDGLGLLAYFALALRTAIGDNEMDHYVDNTLYNGLVWIVWITIVLVGNIIFMNFLIAVVNESYEKCMSKMQAQ